MIALCSEDSIFRRSYVERVLCSENICSEGPIFRWSHIQKILCSEICVQKVLYTEGPICSEDPIFRNICLEGSISRRSYVQKVLYSEDPLLRRSSFFFISFITLLFTSRDTLEWVPKLRRSRNFNFFVIDWLMFEGFLQWYLITLLQLNCRFKNAIKILLCCVLRYKLRCVMRCDSRLVPSCTASLRRILCRLFLYTS